MLILCSHSHTPIHQYTHPLALKYINTTTLAEYSRSLKEPSRNIPSTVKVNPCCSFELLSLLLLSLVLLVVVLSELVLLLLLVLVLLLILVSYFTIIKGKSSCTFNK